MKIIELNHARNEGVITKIRRSYQINTDNSNKHFAMNKYNKEVLIKIAEEVRESPYIHHSFKYFMTTFHISYNSIKTGFKQMYGMTLPHYIEEQCMNKAAVLLMNEDLTLDEIADALGYSGINTFSRAYKRRFGKSPGRYRRNENHEMA